MSIIRAEAAKAIYTPFKSHWTMRRRDFGQGVTEVVVSRADRFVGFESVAEVEARIDWRDLPKAPRGHGDREQSKVFAARRAQKQVRLLCKAIHAEHMFTVSTRENIQCIDTFLVLWKRFHRRLKDAGIRLRYVAVPERQKRGAWHMHIAAPDRAAKRIMIAVWQSVVGAGQGYVHHRSPFKEKGLRHKLAGYLAKYIGKTFADADDSNLNRKRYYASRCIDVPKNELVHLGDIDVVDAIKQAFRAAIGSSTAEDLVYWWNPHLEVFWIATKEVAQAAEVPF